MLRPPMPGRVARRLDEMAGYLARAIRAIKADTMAQQLQDEFFAGSEAPF
jgi:hypothetical protein